MKNLLFVLISSVLLFSCAQKKTSTTNSTPMGIAALTPTATSEPRYLQPGDSVGTYDTVTIKTAKVLRYLSYQADSTYTVVSKYVKPTGSNNTTTPPPVTTEPLPTTGIPSTAKQVFYADMSVKSIFENDNGTYYQLGRGALIDDGTGNKVFNSLVNAGDGSISGGYRSEFTIANMPMTGDMYFIFRAKMMKYPGTDQGHFFQVHPSNSTGSAAFGIYFSNKQFSVIRSIVKYSNIYETARKSYNLNQWYNFRVHAKWSTGTDGLIEVFIDDSLFQTSKGQNLPSEGGYLKFGINMWSQSAGSPTTGMNIQYDYLRIFRN